MNQTHQMGYRFYEKPCHLSSGVAWHWKKISGDLEYFKQYSTLDLDRSAPDIEH
ncbi:MAG: hypothetical protein L3J79_01880 [Candidatus Marinimicrobia bacterium]|nr:hypothetical protein [Candidatus Neomarinimicrobiota bacterium]